MIHTRKTGFIDHAADVVQPIIFYPDRSANRRTRLLASLLIALSMIGAVLFASLGFLFWPTYMHHFTPYLKWQDALLAILWYSSFILLVGSIVVARFLIALSKGQRHGILILQDDRCITLRDLSPKNLPSIYWMVGTSFSCCLAALVGLSPDILIGWTLHIAQPVLLVLATAIAIVLSIGGLVVTLISASFVFIALMGALSFARKLGAPQTYQLTVQTTLRIDGLLLTVTYPDRPEALFDLNLLRPSDRQRLLQLLEEVASRSRSQLLPHPLVDLHIEAALEEVQRIFINSQNCTKNS